MSDLLDRGITVTEMAPMDQPIDVSLDSTAAFVGRALRGPLDTPTLVNNFAEFRRRFGGFWPGSSLGSAVDLFFRHGGRSAWVIRVANSARAAMICLPATGGVLVLRAIDPGSAEHVRASVDYDGIDEDNDELFNLTLQRVAPDTGLVLDQEIYRRLSCDPQGDRPVGEVLLTSLLVRAQLPLPARRPLSTNSGYLEPAQSGTDGFALSDYDLIGSASRGTGIFALEEVEKFDFLHLPPPELGRVPGPAAVLAAELYCRRRGAMLILDPPSSWETVDDVIQGVRQSGFANPDVISYFPRVRLRDDDNAEPLAIGGAVAGLLCKLDRKRGPWEDLDQRGFSLEREFVPAIGIGPSDAHLLVKEGVNVVAGMTPGHTVICGSVTLAHGTQARQELASLTTRRLCLKICNAIDRATRWAVFETHAGDIGERIASKVHAFMCALSDSGAFENGHFLVQCDAGPRQQPLDPDKGITLLLAFQPAGSRELVSLTLHQSTGGCRTASTAFPPVRAEVA